MKQLYYAMVATALILTQSCSFEESDIKPDIPQDAAYKVQIYNEINQQPATKVTTDGFCTGDEVGVYLVNYEGQTPGALKVEGNQADNVRFTFNENGDWVSDYDIYYKDNETNVDIYGYYPYADPTSIEAYPFEVARDQSKGAEHGQMAPYEASDFLWAKTKNVTPTASKVILSFNHKMSSARVRFTQGSGWADAAEYAAVSKEVLVTNTIRKSTINLSTGVVTPEGEAPLTGIVPLKDYDEFRAIVVPQTVVAGQTLLTITVDGKPRHYVRDVATEYLPGKITTYELSISKKADTGEYEVELTGVNITAWEADNVSHGEDAREYVVVHNAVPGGLERTIVDRLEMDPTKIKNLKLTGSITNEDYTFMRDKMTSLQRLNLKEVESKCYFGKYTSDVNGPRYHAIPEEAFYEKSTLIKCVLPDKLEYIYQNAFAGTPLTGTLLLPEGLKYVSGFRSTKITNVHFPSTLEVIGEHAFESCFSLMCELYLPTSLKSIDVFAFSGSTISGNLVLPENVETIGSCAFQNCSGLTGSLVIPDKITSIPNSAFISCGFTGTLSLPKRLVEVGGGAFAHTPFRGELNFPESVISIGNDAFCNTQFNGTLVLPSGLVDLGYQAFSNCSRLSGVVEIPENIVAIPSSLFYGCSGLEGVVLHKDVEVIGPSAFENCFGITSIICNAKTPPTIDPSSFNGVAKDNFTVEVPEVSVNSYKNASNWSEFKRFAAHREFSISRNLFRTLNEEHSKTFVLRAPSGEKWSVESKPEWVTVEPMSGTGKTDVTVTINTLEHGAGNRFDEIKFLLDEKDYRSTMSVEQYDYQYGDGDMITLQESTKGAGVNIVLMGDCFDAKDISEGKYLQAIQDAYGYFFDIEPYLTYKDYFNIYGVFGMSADSGMGTVNTIREARFGSQYTLNEGVSPDFEKTFAAACVAPINDDVSRTLVIMIENSSDYSGLCYMWGDGSAVAVVPMSEDPAPYDFRGLVHHEAGGHGFGKLADEYIYYNSFIQTCIFECSVSEVEIMKSYGFYDNISLTGDMHSVPWSHMIFDPQYSNTVDVYEGAFKHSRGVFRSEPTSCMHNNIPYYNAISREAMVKRIMEYAGEEYSFEDFKANDKEALPSVTTKSEWIWSEGTGSSSRFDQMPPKFMGEKPSFKKSDF
jgi:hypothetical protein